MIFGKNYESYWFNINLSFLVNILLIKFIKNDIFIELMKSRLSIKTYKNWYILCHQMRLLWVMPLIFIWNKSIFLSKRSSFALCFHFNLNSTFSRVKIDYVESLTDIREIILGQFLIIGLMEGSIEFKLVTSKCALKCSTTKI